MNFTFLHFGIGIDTARYGHHVSFLDSEKRTAAKAFHFNEDAEGYQKLLLAMKRLQQKGPHVHLHVRIDPAGRYADNLVHWLNNLDFPMLTVSVGTPAKNKAYREAHYDKRKADPMESVACARFAVVERPESMKVIHRGFFALRAAVAALESSATTQTRLVNQLHALLASSFPELAKYASDLSAGSILALLSKYPTSKRIAAAKSESILAIPHMAEDMAKAIQQAAKCSTASLVCELQESLIKAKVQELLTAQQVHKSLVELTQKAWNSLPEGPHRRILSIKAIGIQTASALVAKMGSIDRFSSDSALIGYFGIFPEQVDVSGTNRDGKPKSEVVSHMSRKGNDLVRRLLYLAAQCAIKHNPAVKALYARQAALGKPYNVIAGHCMAKLLRQVYAVWVKDCDYDPEYETRQPAVAQEVTTTNPKVVSTNFSGKRPALNFTILKSKLSISDVLKQSQWKERTRRGGQLRGPCLIHGSDSDDRSFAVNTNKNVYCCHSCGSQGNALDLLAAISSKPLHEAAWEWIETTGMEPPTL